MVFANSSSSSSLNLLRAMSQKSGKKMSPFLERLLLRSISSCSIVFRPRHLSAASRSPAAMLASRTPVSNCLNMVLVEF